jgi:AraC-like DNA-binding protein
VRIRRWAFDEPFADLPAAHDGFEVAWSHRGVVEYRIGGELLRLLPGAAIIVPAMVEHATSVTVGGSAGSLLLATDVVRAASERAGRRLTTARLIAGTPTRPARHVGLGMRLDALLFGSAAAHGEVDGVVDELVDEVVRAGDAERDPRIRRTLALIEERYAAPLTVDELARAAKMSRFHFTRVFRAVTGKTPHQYVLDVRLTRAADLLRARRCTVTEAAFRVGYSDVGRFGRMFQRLHGMRPSELLVQGAAR